MSCDSPEPKKLYIETVGCQMNVLDTELVVDRLRGEGYVLTQDLEQADAILYNTCSVRQHAEDKIYSALGRIKRLKERRPEVSIGVLGCMAQKDQGRILKRAPHVDVVIGPGQLGRVGELLRESRSDGEPRVAVSLPRNGGTRLEVTDSFESYDPDRAMEPRPSRFQAFVRVMMGCDKFCTYCIVPSVRGPEQSRPPVVIYEEARRLVDQGVVEITLLGQTVNSYAFRTGDGRHTRLSDLMERLQGLPGLKRLKFITSFPRDMGDDLLQAVRDIPIASKYLHVPAQSGCDEMLRRMKRLYTLAEYDEMMCRIRETIPGAAVSSDFIVGFPGETEASFERSVELVQRSRFKNSFIFKYSPREGTKAYTLFQDDVPDQEKRRRNNELLAVQSRISREDNQAFRGQAVTILVEGPSKTAGAHNLQQWTGRTACDRIVVFESAEDHVGEFVRVSIEDCSSVTLFGSLSATHGLLP